MEEYSNSLSLGKVSRNILERSVFPFIPLSEKPSLDGGVLWMKGRTVVAHSPSIGVPLESLGFFGFHYAASNVACLFAQPRHLITGIYLPLSAKESDLRIIAIELGEEAKRYGVTVAAGQTATYYGLEIPLIASTCLGEPVKQHKKPREGDSVIIIGTVGEEALWLKELSEGIIYDRWRSFTPLPAALRLQEVEGVRLMHDVSEGGVKGAIQEIVEALNIGLDVSSQKILYAEGVDELGQDALRVPTYGTLIAIIEPDATEEVLKVCRRMNIPCADAGYVKNQPIARIDGEKVDGQRRTELDEFYGTFKQKGP